MNACQTDDRLQAAIIGGVDVVDPAGLGGGRRCGDAVEKLFGPRAAAHQVANVIELPGDVADIAAFLHHRVDAEVRVTAARRHGQPAPAQCGAGNGGIGPANQDAVAVDACRAGDIGEAAGQRVRQPYARPRDVTGVGERVGVRHRGAGQQPARSSARAQAHHWPRCAGRRGAGNEAGVAATIAARSARQRTRMNGLQLTPGQSAPSRWRSAPTPRGCAG